jgi:hypothetical protein
MEQIDQQNAFGSDLGKLIKEEFVGTNAQLVGLLTWAEHVLVLEAIGLVDDEWDSDLTWEMDRMEEQLWDLIGRYRQEFDLTYGEVVGVLELAKTAMSNIQHGRI